MSKREINLPDDLEREVARVAAKQFNNVEGALLWIVNDWFEKERAKEIAERVAYELRCERGEVIRRMQVRTTKIGPHIPSDNA